MRASVQSFSLRSATAARGAFTVGNRLGALLQSHRASRRNSRRTAIRCHDGSAGSR
jgi:hypothetical protein